MKNLLPALLVILSFNAISQEHWEDNFWRAETKKRYEETSAMAGLYTVFYRNGQIKWQGKCLENGTPDSTWVYYNKSGQKLWEGEYNGKYTEYDWRERDLPNPPEPGSIYIRGNYRNGLKDGEWLQYDTEGNITRRGYYVNGRPSGTWERFRPKRTVTDMIKTEEYDFATGIRKIYGNDSVRTEKIDSAAFADDHNFGLQTGSMDAVNFGLHSSLHYIDFTKLNRYYYQPGSHQLSNQVGALGFEYAGSSGRFYGALSVDWIPAITADLNDSVRLRLAGFFSSLSFGCDLLNSDVIQVIPAMGIGFQRLRLKVSEIRTTDTVAYTFNEGESRVYRNPSPTLDGMLNIRLNLNELSLNVAGGYSLECAGSKWKYNGRYLKDSPATSASGVVFSVSLGFHFPN